MDQRYSFEEFLDIIKTLRGENGCPWDKEQTHESLKPCVMEEAAELVSSIRIYDKTGNAENMEEELGDLLLQVVMHSEIAKEEGLFSIEDVIHKEAEKMVRRHPHIFGDASAETSEQVLSNWDEIKKKEKEGKSWIESPLREIPKELPSLTRAPKVLKKVDKLYQKGKSQEEDISDIKVAVNHLSEKMAAGKKEDISEEIGSLLLAVSDIARLYKLSLEQILTDRIEDLIDTMEPL